MPWSLDQCGTARNKSFAHCMKPYGCRNGPCCALRLLHELHLHLCLSHLSLTSQLNTASCRRCS